ncbi:class C beta-lactamase-related serine hydrolase [Chryseobacterium gleum]|uniref:serine hydrolase domain-containing protein n=1 Tax=Chryseobacterium gleum TaxID=250 RepID=UPI00103BB086|nr:serine hydrolase [Chryseobacterium gleum]QBJ88475.1 class C beta-lactamase-related serine hydrolase [Chryseobacterium gleum]
MRSKQVLQVMTMLCLILFCPEVKSQAAFNKELPKEFNEKFTKEINDSIPSLGSFIVSQNDRIIYEQYSHGAGKETVFSIKSVTKSIVSVLAGIAKDKNLLPNLNTPVLKILPEYNVSRSSFKNISNIEGKVVHDSIRNTLTLKNLLTMQGGFDWVENSKISTAMSFSGDPVKFVLDLPFEEYPGTVFNYNSGESHLFGAALAKIVKTNLKQFATENLFRPLKMNTPRWDTDSMNRNIAGSEMFLKPEDMLKFGLMVLNNGKLGGRQIVSQKWIQESTAEQVKLNFWDVMPDANGYGYYWWRRKTNGHQAFVATGYGGQLICVIPDLKIVIVTTCFLNDKNRGRTEIKRLHYFIDKMTKEVV